VNRAKVILCSGRLAVLVAVVAVVACGGSDRSAGSSAGLTTVYDSTADTIVARVEGQVPVPALRTMTLVVRIAPAMDDTSLFAEVSDFEIDEANRIWVYDFQGRRLFLFDSAGTLVRRIGRSGQGPGEFSQGNGLIARADTGIAVLDARNARVSFFAANGDFRSSFTVPSGFSTSNGLLTDRSRAMYLRRPVTPPREGEILGRMGLVRLQADYSFGDSLTPPDLPVPRDVFLAVSPDGRSRSSTSSSHAASYFWDWHPDGFFVVGHGGKYEIVIARPDARPIVIRRVAPPVPLMPEERTEEKEQITWNMRQTQPGWNWSGPEIPESKPPMLGLRMARDGNIWARVATPSELIPTDQLPPETEKGPPVSHFRSHAIYEVFAPDGRFLARIPMPPRTTMLHADGDYFWGISRDNDDLPSIVRFRIVPPFNQD
jgi:hypothetical protein